ncbi:MAG: hypothetical protein ABI183_13625 [Polyangiaceae bacterium]
MVKHFLFAAFVATALSCSLDPTHDEAQSDLGDEAPGVSPGPDHRPGQPCLICHDGTTAPQWSVAGTVTGVLGSTAPLHGATVSLTDANLSTFTATSNEVGNFWIESGRWQPTYPVKVAITYGSATATMSTIIGRDGSCAGCHASTASRISPGPVYVAATAAQLSSAGGSP